MTIAWAQAVKQLAEEHPLEVLLRMAGLPRSTYYWAIRHADDISFHQFQRIMLSLHQMNQLLRRILVNFPKKSRNGIERYHAKIAHLLENHNFVLILGINYYSNERNLNY